MLKNNPRLNNLRMAKLCTEGLSQDPMAILRQVLDENCSDVIVMEHNIYKNPRNIEKILFWWILKGTQLLVG